ncbi:MAG TPA: hypothetical protein VJ276_17920 [Thermoanaerobaculia bacterium]|nr:hypothetical protein [Thermoanaerobaculia bacterium]
MRNALVLCLLIVACRNESNERLARMEKRLDQIQQTSSAETTDWTNPPSVTSGSTDQERSAIKSVAANTFVHQRLGAFVPLRHGPDGLVYQIKPGAAFLYQYDSSTYLFSPIAKIPDIIGADGFVHLTREQRADFAHKLGDEPQKATPGHSALNQRWAEESVASGSGAFVPFRGDSMFGMVFQTPEGTTILYRWDATQALYLPIADVDPIIGPDRRVSVSVAAKAYLQDLLEHSAAPEPPAKLKPPFNALSQAVVENCVESGVCAFVSLKNDPMYGCAFQAPQQVTILYRWDADKALFMPVAEVEPIVGADHRPSIGEVQLAHLRSLLETQ